MQYLTGGNCEKDAKIGDGSAWEGRWRPKNRTSQALHKKGEAADEAAPEAAEDAAVAEFLRRSVLRREEGIHAARHQV